MSVDQLAQLTKRDLLLEQRLQGISKRSIPSKEMEDTPPTNLINSVQGDINLRDMGIEEQLQKISRNAIKDVLGWKPTQIKSDITNEMIQEYQDEVANSFYDDPITGKRLRYVPVGSDMTLEEYRPQDTLEKIGLTEERIRAEQRHLAAERAHLEELIRDEYENLEQVKGSIEFNSDLISFKRKSLAEKYEEEDYLNFVAGVERTITKYKERISIIDSLIAGAQKQLEQNVKAQSENQAEKSRIEKSNYRLLQEKSDQLNLLNRGQLNITRQPSESDDDFRQRLIDVGQVEFDETAIEQAAGRRAMLKFKQNMKEITRNNILIENIIKSVDDGRLFLYNKYFSIIKTKFKEVYGSATFKDGDFPEVIDIFDAIIDKNKFEVDRDVREFRDIERQLKGVDFEPEPLQSEVDYYNRLKAATEAFPEAVESAPIANARLVEPTPAQAVEPTKIGKNPYTLTKPQLIKSFGKAYKEQTGNNLALSMKKEELQRALVETGIIRTEASYSGTQPLQTFFKEGEGLYEKLPTKAQFGKICINPKALYYDNTLIITSNGRNHLTGYRNIKVSDDFVSIIMKIMKGENPNHKELQKLDLSEKELYDNVIHLAHLHKKVDHNLAQTKQAMKHRFELLNGEIGAGNTNKMLKKELTDLVHKMAYAGMISHHQRNKFVKSL